MTRVTTADLDRLEFRAVQSGDHAEVARELADLANQVDADSEICRAELFVRAGEQWEMAQEFELAVAIYQRAIDDGGVTIIDARALQCGALLELDRVEEARTQLDRLRAEGPRNLPTYIHIAETLQAHDDLTGAHEWATLGVERFRHQDVSPYMHDLLLELLRIRFRIRMDLGFTEDDLDRLLDG
ncbi:hypothetical protein ACQEU5_07490 [Marinactinospora thermotolerans]|uniref:Tetratricopeptide repeat-containing protein n=1 Tax=Marinactinospora thermotolerans DSM 45154 TaxID=1122192 RepID=A0A1T4R3Z4_9ACTN|nr:hypothetical protein [Marinactinospora thermotolerans]SKA10669.1 hypothetical protein SAMN02745673_02504 [Marinactinospora thermotolerans DSM 45154]